MKKNCFFLIAIIVLIQGMLFPQANKSGAPIKKPGIKAYQLTKAVIYRKELLVLAESDSLCPYLIRDKLTKDIVITGAEVQELYKTQFSDGDRLFINRGTLNNVTEGQMYFVLGKGKTIRNRMSGKNLGIYYIRKGITKVTCTYEDRAITTLEKVCHPVEIGDILIPFEEEQRLYQIPFDFRKCRLPQSPYAGDVVYMGMYLETERELAGTHHYVTVDIGKAAAQRGDWVVFYKVYGPKLPPVIIGTGIVVVPEKTNSTVKIIEITLPATIGTKALLIQGPRKKDMLTPEQKQEEETLPILEVLDEGPGKEKGYEADVLFDFNDSQIKEETKAKLEPIKEFIAAHPSYEVILSGYCCSIGGEQYNLQLSQTRVENLMKYLIDTFGIKQDVIKSNYYGEKDAPYDNSTEEQRRLNRMVNINIQIVER